MKQFTYNSASISAFKLLDLIHYTVIRTIVGAFIISPIASILKVENEPPLTVKREILSATQAIKNSTTPDRQI